MPVSGITFYDASKSIALNILNDPLCFPFLKSYVVKPKEKAAISSPHGYMFKATVDSSLFYTHTSNNLLFLKH